ALPWQRPDSMLVEEVLFLGNARDIGTISEKEIGMIGKTKVLLAAAFIIGSASAGLAATGDEALPQSQSLRNSPPAMQIAQSWSQEQTYSSWSQGRGAFDRRLDSFGGN